MIAKLEHSGIVPVHDAGTLPDGRPYYTMKLVQGKRLDELGREAQGGMADRLRMFLRICEPVAFAHAHGVLHRDLKPANIMIGPFGEVLVMDWGLSKLLVEGMPWGTDSGSRPRITPQIWRRSLPPLTVACWVPLATWLLNSATGRRWISRRTCTRWAPILEFLLQDAQTRRAGPAGSGLAQGEGGGSRCTLRFGLGLGGRRRSLRRRPPGAAPIRRECPLVPGAG